MMNILVAAKELRLDRGSEGICSAKFLLTLARAGNRVRCLTSDDLPIEQGFVPWLESVPITRVAVDSQRPATQPSAVAPSTSVYAGSNGYLRRRINSLSAYTTGFHLRTWREVKQWQRALRQAVAKERPDVIIARGAGQGFEPHMALTRSRCSVPWIANYHDPYPVSLYPEPYRRRTPIVSHWQEVEHRRILAATDALTFPSQRLLEWVLDGASSMYRQKAFVLPHVASGLFESHEDSVPDSIGYFPNGEFSIIHTGTLLDGRYPWGLLKAFHEFIGQDPEKRRRARLVLVGKAGKHAQHPEWQRWVRPENVLTFEQRVHYLQALALMRAATACVVLEAHAEASPFFPAKLADCLWLRKPILALSPAESTTADLLTSDYPLLVAPDDVTGIKRSLNRIWEHWKLGRCAALVPSHKIVENISEEAVLAALEGVMGYLVAHKSSGADRNHARLYEMAAAR